MFRFLAACLAILLVIAARQSVAQGFTWMHHYEADSTEITRDPATGDIYVVSIDILNGFVHPVVDRYSANGALVNRSASSVGFGIYTSSQVLDAQFRNGKFYCIYVATNNSPYSARSFRATYNPQTNSVSLTSLAYQSGEMQATCASIGQTTYFVGGRLVSDGKGVGQVRDISNDSVLLENATGTQEINHAFLRGNDTYVTSGLTQITQNYYLAVHRFSSSTHSSTYALSAFFGDAFSAMSHDENFLYTGIAVFNSVGFEYDFHVRAINLTTNQFQNLYSVTGGTDDQIRAMNAIGSSDVAVFSSSFIQGLTPAGVPTFKYLTPSVVNARATTDSGGNCVAIYQSAADLVYLRLDEAGNVRTRVTEVGAGAFPEGITLDSAGIVRCLYYTRPIPWDKDRVVAQFNPASLDLPGPYTVGGDTLIATINIGDHAPAGGAAFDLQSNNAAATVPASVTIPAGQSSATFTINTTPVAANAKPLINARYDGLVLQSTFDLAAPLIKQVTATPQSQYGGNNITGAVYLTGKAPTGGKVVTLASSNTAKATVPASTTLSAGSSGKTFIITTVPTLINASSVITATTGAVSKTVFIAILAPVLQSAALGSTSITGGTSTTMTVTLNAKAPSGYTVTLLSGSTVFVQLPSSYAVPAGATTANVPVLTSAVTTTVPVTLVAYRGPYVKTMTLTLTP